MGTSTKALALIILLIFDDIHKIFPRSNMILIFCHTLARKSFCHRDEFKHTLLLWYFACYVHVNTWPNFFGHTSTSSHIIIVIIPLLQR